MPKTLPVNVYANDHFRHCSNGGVTEMTDFLYLTGVEGAWYDMPDGDPRLLKLGEKNVCGETYHFAEPVSPINKTDKSVGPMMGGSFIYTCDSRFPFPYPIPVHDRYEDWETYNRNCD